MVLSFNSSVLHRRRYLARTIPAGQVFPPHPSVKSCLRIKGVSRRPEKSRDTVGSGRSVREGTKSSAMVRKLPCGSEDSPRLRRVMVRGQCNVSQDR